MRHIIVLLISTLIVTACDPKPPATGDTTGAPASDGTTSTPPDFSAHWLDPDIILIQKAAGATDIRLHYSLDADIRLDGNKIELNASPSFGLNELSTDANFTNKFKGFSEQYTVVRPEITINQGAMRLIVKGQVVVVQKNDAGNIIKASQVQTARLIDYLYTSRGNDANEVTDFGAQVLADGVQFKLWAPTARDVDVLLFDADKRPLTMPSLSMSLDPDTGVWSAKGDPSLNQRFYQYKITLYHPASQRIETLITTDPYSVSLSSNSEYSQVVDLSDPSTQPSGWETHSTPTLANYEDAILYEVHIRDFSARDNALSNEKNRGKYAAFGEQNSHGMKHLKSLREAGLTHVHLLPAFDIATVNEDPEQTIYPDDTLDKVCRIAPNASPCQGEFDKTLPLSALLESLSPKTGDVQAIIESMREHDMYNWGYDPFHYSVPEGSYATNADGITRIVEFRQMVKDLHEQGFRVVMDVVYNHTFVAGLNSKSVLDKIVPNYYHRLDQQSGAIEQSTCCDNTATENAMMAKLMIDSLALWAEHYRIDGFRFDLMGHQPKHIMLQAYERVRAIDPDNYFYGEGWNFGEVANNRYFVQATQTELGGTEIGTFSDRLRDAVRGGAFNATGLDLRATQGFGNGLFSLPNETRPQAEQRDDYLLASDQIRVGLTGNLANYPLDNAAGDTVTGKEIPYGDGPTGYAFDPADTVNYVSKHDNQTLWDNHQYRIAFDTSTEDRVRMHTLSLAVPLLSQGIPFIHMGSELLRSKSFLRDSYDYGDWFNAVDFSMQSNNYNVGLPPAVKDKDNWDLIKLVLEKNEGRDIVGPEHIRYSSEIFKEWLRIRSSSPLFRLTNEQAIIDRVRFHNTGASQTLGVIAMSIDDSDQAEDLDKERESIMVIFNNRPDTVELSLPNAGYQLHPIQAQGLDERIKATAAATPQGFRVPGLSAVVFVR